MKREGIIIAIYITFLLSQRATPSTLEMLTMVCFCRIHISCHRNGFMFNSAWGPQACRKLCWIYDRILKAERGVPLIRNCSFQNVYPSQNQRQRLRAYAKCDGQPNIHMLSGRSIDEAPRVLCPTPSASGDDILPVIGALTII